MTEGQRDTDEASLQLQAVQELAKLTARLRANVALVPCDFCGKMIPTAAYNCDRCGWKVAV